MRSALASLALAALALTGACGDERASTNTGIRRVPGCEQLEDAPCDVRTASCQQRLFQLAICLRGDQPGDLPPISVVSEADFAAMLTAEAAASPAPANLATRDWALSALKVIAPGALTPSAITAESTKATLGEYRPSTKDILVIDHGAAFDDSSASPVLVHELVHALQDREVDLAKVDATIVWSQDASFAATAIVEGEARMHETRYRAALAGYDVQDTDLMKHFENAVTLDQNDLLSASSPLTKTRMRFPYEWGARYVWDLWQNGGMDAVHARLLAPPTTTRVLRGKAPSTAPSPPSCPRPRSRSRPRLPDDRLDRRRLGCTLGAWTLFLTLGVNRSHAGRAGRGAGARVSAPTASGSTFEQPAPGNGNRLRVANPELADEASAARLGVLATGLGPFDARTSGATDRTIAKTSDGTSDRLGVLSTVFAFGHLGIGKKIAALPYRRFSPVEKRAFFLGALLPDLIDKPLFYIPFWLTGRPGGATGILSGTHLFAHTGLFLLALVVAALISRARPLRAVAIGVATHFILDIVGLSMGLGTLLWPLFGWRFPVYPFKNLGQHLGTILSPVTLAGELCGAAILTWDYWKARRRPPRTEGPV